MSDPRWPYADPTRLDGWVYATQRTTPTAVTAVYFYPPTLPLATDTPAADDTAAAR